MVNRISHKRTTHTVLAATHTSSSPVASYTILCKVSDNVVPPIVGCNNLRRVAVPGTTGVITLGTSAALAFGTAIVGGRSHS